MPAAPRPVEEVDMEIGPVGAGGAWALPATSTRRARQSEPTGAATSESEQHTRAEPPRPAPTLPDSPFEVSVDWSLKDGKHVTITDTRTGAPVYEIPPEQVRRYIDALLARVEGPHGDH